MLEGMEENIDTGELEAFAEIAELHGQPMLALAFRLELQARTQVIPMQQLISEAA